jgi:hypothetical protein
LAKNIINGEQVNIAFSSISFEHWILLHFEKNETAFKKPKCRKGREFGREFMECGTNQHPEDCQGEKCVCGYLSIRNYAKIECVNKSFSFARHFPNLFTAFKNAIWLRNLQKERFKELEVFNLNPYTDVDKMIFQLFHPFEVFHWIEKNGDGTPKEIRIKIDVIPDRISFILENHYNRSLIVNSDSLGVYDDTGNWHFFGARKVMPPDSNYQETFMLNRLKGHTPLYFSYQHEYTIKFIADC